MDHEIVFLLGVYVLPLAFVSLVSAWAGGRRPWVALGLGSLGVGLITWVAFHREGGAYALRDIPDMSVMLVAQLRALF